MEEIKLTMTFEEHQDGVTGWCNEIKGIVADGESMEAVRKTLFELISANCEISRNESKIKDLLERPNNRCVRDIATISYID